VAGSLLSAEAPLDEDRFARVALWGLDVPSLPQLFVEKGYLRREQSDAILQVMTTRSPQQWRNQLGQLALGHGMITEEQLRECLEAQTKLVMTTGSAPFLGHILIERGYMTEAQVLAILKAQEQRHIGMLHELEAALVPPAGRIADFLRRNPRLLWSAVFVVAVAVAGMAGAWLYAYATAPPTFDLICEACGCRMEGQAAVIAQPCPRCGRGELFTPLWCRTCRLTFPLRIHSSEGAPPWVESCPTCGSLRHVELPRGLDGLDTHPRPARPQPKP
jgi:predicted RNA-binding Zn-ribbon protein involved in translation (DUF1610 family)